MPPPAGGAPQQYQPPVGEHSSAGQPPVPPGAEPPATEGLGPAPQKPKSGAGKKVVGILLVILVALVVIGLKTGVRNLFGDGDKTSDVAVGECITEAPKAEDMKPVACTDATAAHKVVGKVDGVTQSQFQADTDLAACKPYATTKNALWSGKSSGKGYVLCLEPVKK